MALQPAPSMGRSAALRTTHLAKAHAATIIALLLLLFMDLGGAVNVGDAEVHRDLISAASGSGAGAENANNTCPNVTTVLVYSTVSSTTPTSVQIVDAACERVVVTATTTTSSEVLLDLQDRGIVEIKSLPPNVQLLQLANNNIKTLDGLPFPAAVRSLNVSRNPIASIQLASFPSSLTELDLARTSLTTVQNLSFPNAMTSLNISGNAVTRISGVTFPASLEYLHFNLIGPITASDAESTASVFEEFEVRQTDATRFARLTVFDVAVTTKVTCSDSRAKRTYVQDTMLCVLPDDVFLSKYGLASNTNTAASSIATPVPVLDEDMDQSRSWFLLIGGGLLSAFVVCFFCIAGCNRCRRRHLETTTKETQVRQQSRAASSQKSVRYSRVDKINRCGSEDDSKRSNLV